MEPVGKVNDLAKEFNFEWKIDNFFSLSKEDGKSYYTSPLFSFGDESWYLTVYPNGDPYYSAVGYISVYLYTSSSDPPFINLSWSFGLKTFDGKKVHEEHHTVVFGEDDTIGYGSEKLLKRCTLLERKSELVPSNILTIVLTIDYFSKSRDDAGNNVTAACSHCKEAFVAECLSSHEQKCLDKPIRCPTCSDVVALREWFDHECQTAKVKATEKVIDDLADILDCEQYSDVTIKVKDQEFRLHRNILAGRNAYFRSMFNTDMKEKTTGMVSIDDCEANIFSSFINFVYTGELYALSYDNVCALYKVADKYQEDQVKVECLCFMKNKMSIDSFCDFVVLALMHNEKELLQNATQLFCKETKEIIQSVKWQTFMREYPTQANELYIKALDYNSNECMKCRANCE